MANLIVERGREKGTSVELKLDAPCVAGRDPTSAQIVISDPAASRRHFQVAPRDGKWYVTDLGSKNHTFLNEERLEGERELSSGDRIQVGETVVSFLDEDKGDKSAAQGLNGKEIGGYKILDRLGRGGMGTVFKARQISLNRVIALKVLSSKFAKDPKFVEKFVSEARAAGQLNHPNVVQVFDVGQLGGLHFFSMELMEGGCVQDLLTAAPEGRLSWQEAMPLIVDAARGLVFAEKRGIVHRDIKPDNLMLTSEQRVKIGDLGLAKKAEEGSGDKAIFGTPHFIAPEQAQGKEVGHPADLYALGATFYRMVTGRTPFNGETVKEILKKQISEPHQPIPQIVPDFPADLSAIVDKLMAKKVENRYQSATKLLEDLEAFQLAHQIELSGAKKLNKPLMIGAIVVAVAAAGVGIYYATRPPEVHETTREVEKIVEVGDKGPKLTPEQQRQLIAAPAERAYFAIFQRDPRDISLEKEAELLKLAVEYEALAKNHPDPAAAEAIRPGLERAKEIRTTLQRLKDEKTATETAAKTWWDQCRAKIDEFEKAKRWQEAIQYADGWLKSADAAKHMLIVKDAKDELAKVEAREIDLAEKDLHAVVVEAEAQRTAGEYEKAIELLKKWAEDVEATSPTNEKLKSLVETARTKRGDWREEYVTTLLTKMDADKTAYVDAVRALRTGGSGAGVVFDYDFAAAAAQFQSAANSLTTYPYRDRATKRVAHLVAAQTAWSAWIQLLGDGKVFAAGDEMKGLPGASPGVTYRLNLEERPTEGKFTVDTVLAGGAGKAKKDVSWADLTREELAGNFVLAKVGQVPGDVAVGLAWMFVELGHPAAAQALLDRATAAGAQIAGDDETALRREINALAGYDELRKKAGGDANEVVAAVQAWRQTFAGTDAYVLLDGRPANDLQILTNEQIDAYMKNLGRKSN